MRPLVLILSPLIAGTLTCFIPNKIINRILLVCLSLGHAGVLLSLWIIPEPPNTGNWIHLDQTGLFFLSIASLLFLASSVYSLKYLQQESVYSSFPDHREGDSSKKNEKLFLGCMHFFLSSMSLVTMSQHIGILWVAMEATTLSTAPLIYFNKNSRSLEATWKYLVICSVGIALGLLGNIFISVSACQTGQTASSLLFPGMISRAIHFKTIWLKTAFIFFLVGYGTKMGLAPFHTWLPDAHSEAPSPVSALLSGALLNCAFLSLLRIYSIASAAGLASFAQDLFRLFGILSLIFSSIFILGQNNYKRMLAYSSVEHMGILIFGIGLGGLGAWGSIFHVLNHSFVKAALFLISGNILTAYKTKSINKIQGILHHSPLTGILWLAGLFAISGMPPFGTFFSKFMILQEAILQQRLAQTILFLFFLAVIFISMSKTVLFMSQGERCHLEVKTTSLSEFICTVLPPLLLLGWILLLGFYLPDFLRKTITEITMQLQAG